MQSDLMPAETLEGLIERVTFYNPINGYTVVQVRVRGRRELVTMVGTLPAVQPWRSSETAPRRCGGTGNLCSSSRRWSSPLTSSNPVPGRRGRQPDPAGGNLDNFVCTADRPVVNLMAANGARSWKRKYRPRNCLANAPSPGLAVLKASFGASRPEPADVLKIAQSWIAWIES